MLIILFIYILIRIIIGSDVDFDSNPFNITVNSGATEGRGNISVIPDNIVEGPETFNIGLKLASDNLQITLGRVISEGLITDSISECIVQLL